MKEHTGVFQELQNFQSGQIWNSRDRGGGKLLGRSTMCYTEGTGDQIM